MSKTYKKNLLTIAACLCLVVVLNLSHYFLSKANPSSAVRFTSDTIVSLSGLSDGDLYVRTDSECNSLSVSGSTLTITGIPDGNSFTLKTPQHNNALKLSPSGGTLDLTFDSSNLSSGSISQWTLDASSGTEAAHTVGTSQANTWYAIKADNALFNSFQSNDSGEVSFTYDGGFSSKTLTIEVDTTAPTEFGLVSPVNNAVLSESKPSFSWNASTDPDISYYQLYIDDSLDTDNITGTSVTPTNHLSCGEHTWYIKALDKAGNSTDASRFNLTISCGGGLPPTAFSSPASPVSTPENPEGSFRVFINDGAEVTPRQIVTLQLLAGSDTKRMAVSNSPDFAGLDSTGQISYQSSYTWDICQGKEQCSEGSHTVYVKFYTQYGVASEVVSDSIVLDTSAVYPEGSLIRAAGDYRVYIVKDGYRRWIQKAEIFNAYSHLRWEDVIEVSPEELNGYQDSWLIRADGDPRVYEVNADGTKHWLNMTAEEFKRFLPDWSRYSK